MESYRSVAPATAGGARHGGVSAGASAATPRRTAALTMRWKLRHVLAAALVMRLLVLWASSGLPLTITDEQHYADLATSLVSGEGFSQWGGPTSMRPPLYPALIAAVWSAVGVGHLGAIRAVQVLLGLLTVWATYAVALRVYDERTALLAALVPAFYPMLVISGALLLTEIVFTALLMLFVLGTAVLLRTPSKRAALLTGLALGLAALTRSVMWPFVGVVSLVVCVWAPAGPFRRRAAYALLLALGYALVVGPWAYRNTTLQETPVVIDAMGGLNLLMGNYEYTPEDRMWAAAELVGGPYSWARDLPPRAPDGSSWTEGKKEKWAQRRALEYMRAHPWTTLRRSALKFADFWGLEREFVAGLVRGSYPVPHALAVASTVAITASWVAVALLAALGLTLAAPPDRRAHVLMLLVILFVCGVHMVVFAHSRYHLPLVPVLGIYAAAAVSRRAWTRVSVRQTSGVMALALIGVLALVWARDVLIRDAYRIRALLDTLG